MNWRSVLLAGGFLPLLYVGSYLILSRHGFAIADEYHAEGFWFFKPHDSNLWRVSNYGCVYFYYPLILADNALGTGRWPGSEPMWGLSK